MNSDTDRGASILPQAVSRAAVAATALLVLAGTKMVVAAPTPAAPPPVVMAAPGAYTPPPIMATDAPQNKLHLTADQQNKANAIMGGFFQKRVALESNKNQTPTQMQTAYAALAKSTHDQMMGILTPAQKAQLSQIQATQAQYIAGAQAAHAKAVAYSNQLRASFTAAQKAKIDAITKTAVAKLKALITNPKLTIQQREVQSGAIRNSAQMSIKEVLTQSQLATYANVQRYAQQSTDLGRLAQESGV